MAENKDFKNKNDSAASTYRRAGSSHFVGKDNQVRRPKSTPKPQQPVEVEHHPLAWSIMVILLILTAGILVFGYSQYKKAADTFGNTYQASKSSRDSAKILKERKPFSILLMGTDTGELGRTDKGRTDSLILATVNPKTNKTTFTSIPRDTKVVVPGDSEPYEKINAAYTIGGPKTATEVVSKLFNVPIDFYAVVNMGGIEKMVNAVDGIDITPNLTFDYEGISVKKGKTVHMNGHTALQYTRMRYQDPLGDYGRQIRQRQVLEQVLKEGLKVSSVTKYSNILKSLNGNILTNLTFDDMMLAGAQYRGATKNIEEGTLQCDNATVDGVSYQVAPNDELLKVSNQVRKSLGLDESDALTSSQRAINSNEEANSNNSIFGNGITATNNNEYLKH